MRLVPLVNGDVTGEPVDVLVIDGDVAQVGPGIDPATDRRAVGRGHVRDARAVGDRRAGADRGRGRENVGAYVPVLFRHVVDDHTSRLPRNHCRRLGGRHKFLADRLGRGPAWLCCLYRAVPVRLLPGVGIRGQRRGHYRRDGQIDRRGDHSLLLRRGIPVRSAGVAGKRRPRRLRPGSTGGAIRYGGGAGDHCRFPRRHRRSFCPRAGAAGRELVGCAGRYIGRE